MATIQLTINEESHSLNVDGDMPLLWVLRDLLGLTGTKYGCDDGACGACTVHVDGRPERACQVQASAAANKKIVTIEGVAKEGKLHVVQSAWIKEMAFECGYCTSGQIMRAIALLREKPNPSDQDINEAMRDNLCRCAAYECIRRAIHTAAKGGE